MDREYLSKLLDARDTLCGYCKSGSCELCDVRSLVKDAFDELYEEDSE